MRIGSIALLFTLFFALPALADDTAFGGDGSAPMPIGQSEIEMASERVSIAGSAIGDEQGGGRWNVECEFALRNTADRPVKLSVGFPFPTYDEEFGAFSIPKGRVVKSGQPLVYDFEVTVDGRPVKAQRQKIAPNPDRGQNYKDAYIWEMEFAPKQEVKVRHKYSTGVTYDAMAYTWASYVLKTGGNWRGGLIGSARLEVIPNESVKLCREIEKQADYLAVKPAGMKVEGKGRDLKYVWELKDLRPTEDLDICMQTASNYAMRQIVFPVAVMGEPAKQLAALSLDELRTLRNTVYARHGRVFKDKDLQAHFERQWWYAPDPAYNDSMLTDDDRGAVAAIAKAEAGRR